MKGKIMLSDKGRYALVTGGSSGIGYEFVKLLAKDGMNLVIVARNETKLTRVKTEIENKYQVKVKILSKDLSDPKVPVEVFSELEKENINIEILVNNAGFGLHGGFSEIDLQKGLEMIQVHVTSLTHLTKLFLRKMLEKKYGKILNVASTAAFQPGPYHSIYFATKSYILHFSEALAGELQGSGVSVTCLCPGPTETPFFKDTKINQRRLTRLNMMDAPQVAKVGYNALKKGKVVVIPGLKNKLLAFLVRIIPRNIVRKIAAWLMGYMYKKNNRQIE